MLFRTERKVALISQFLTFAVDVVVDLVVGVLPNARPQAGVLQVVVGDGQSGEGGVSAAVVLVDDVGQGVVANVPAKEFRFFSKCYGLVRYGQNANFSLSHIR